MTEFPLLVLVLGPVLLAEALLARYEVMAYTAGWRAPTTELPQDMPHARGADPGAVEELHTQLRAPLLLITIGGFHNGANDLTHAHHLHQLTSASDWIERMSTWIFPQRWRASRRISTTP